jgi:uncharacterized phiE125 gp8 family phage protein
MSAAGALLLLLQASGPAPDAGAWLTLAEAKEHLNAEESTDDDYIAALIDVARGHIEERVGFVVQAETRTLLFPAFEAVMHLPVHPVRSVTAVRYYDETDALATVDSADYRMGGGERRPMLMARLNKSWPSAVAYPDAVQVEAEVGPETRDDLPEDVRHAGKLLVGHWYRNREAVEMAGVSREMDFAVSALLSPFRLSWMAS